MKYMKMTDFEVGDIIKIMPILGSNWQSFIDGDTNCEARITHIGKDFISVVSFLYGKEKEGCVFFDHFMGIDGRSTYEIEIIKLVVE